MAIEIDLDNIDFDNLEITDEWIDAFVDALWPRYDPENQVLFELDNPVKSIEGLDGELFSAPTDDGKEMLFFKENRMIRNKMREIVRPIEEQSIEELFKIGETQQKKHEIIWNKHKDIIPHIGLDLSNKGHQGNVIVMKDNTVATIVKDQFVTD